MLTRAAGDDAGDAGDAAVVLCPALQPRSYTYVPQQEVRGQAARQQGGQIKGFRWEFFAITLGVLVKLKSGLAIALFAPFPHTFPALLGVFTVLE